MNTPVHGRSVGVRPPKRTFDDLGETQYGDEQLFEPPLRRRIGINRILSPLYPPQEAVFGAHVSDASAPVDTGSREDGTDMNRFDFNPMFAAEDSIEPLAYEATPTYNTSNDTLDRQLILTPQSTSRTYSERANLDPNFETQDPLIPGASVGWYTNPALYRHSVEEVDPRELVLRSQTDLPDLNLPNLGSFGEFCVMKYADCSLRR